MTEKSIIKCWYCGEEITITWTDTKELFDQVNLVSLKAHLPTCPYRPILTP